MHQVKRRKTCGVYKVPVYSRLYCCFVKKEAAPKDSSGISRNTATTTANNTERFDALYSTGLALTLRLSTRLEASSGRSRVELGRVGAGRQQQQQQAP